MTERTYTTIDKAERGHEPGRPVGIMRDATEYCPESLVPRDQCWGCREERIADLERRVVDLDRRLGHVQATLESALDDDLVRRIVLLYIKSFLPGESNVAREARLEQEMAANQMITR